MSSKYAVVVLAAGASSRFGSNKLLAQYKDKALFLHTLEKIKNLECAVKIVVTGTDEIIDTASDYGIIAVENNTPESGITRSLKLGIINALEIQPDLTGILFCVCDQPLLKEESIRQILLLADQNQACIICAGTEKRRGNPVYFHKTYFSELLVLTGDQGGKQVIKNNPDKLLLFPVEESELFDIDTIQDLKIIG